MEAVTSNEEIERLLAESEWISGLALHLLGDSHRAEDLAQETRLAALRARPKHQKGSLRPWLATVARNAARKLHLADGARKARESAKGLDRQAEIQKSPEALLENLETQELLSRLVRELPAELSDVILMHFFEGHTLEQVAELRGIPAGTVRWRKKQALDRLRERLDTKFDGDRRTWMSALLPLVRPKWGPASKAATAGGGFLSGLLAPWIAMTATWKLASIAILATLCALPFLLDDGENLQASEGDQNGLTAGEGLEGPDPTETVADTQVGTEPERQAVAQEPVDTVVSPKQLTRIQLRVIDGAGNPMANATVRIADMEVPPEDLVEKLGPMGVVKLLDQMERTTDGQGIARWESDLLLIDGLVDFEVTGPNFESGSITGVLESGGDTDLGDVVALPAGSAAGRVWDNHGPAPGLIRVTLVAVERNEAGVEIPPAIPTGLMSGFGSTRTGPEGRFHFDGVPPGEYRAYVQVDLGKAPCSSQPFEIQVNNETPHVEVRCDASLNREDTHAILVLGADGCPLANAMVTLTLGGFSSSGKVDRDGKWGKAGKVVDRFVGGSMQVFDPSFQHKTILVEPLPNPIKNLIVQLKPAQTVQRDLILTGSDGSQVEQGRVLLKMEETHGWTDFVDGKASLHLPAGLDQTFQATILAPGFASTKLEGLDAQTLPDPWNLDLAPLPGIKGIVFANGKPLAGAKVRLYNQVEAGKFMIHGDDVNLSAALDDKGVDTDAEGRFAFYLPGPGELILTVKAKGFADGLLLVNNYQPEVGATDLELELNEGGQLKGQILDHLGQPVPRARLVVDHPYHKSKRRRANRDGAYHFKDLPEGSWYLRRVDEYASGYFDQESRAPKGWTYPSNCEVIPGKTTQFDLRLADPNSGLVELRAQGSRALTARIEIANGSYRDRDPFLQDWEASVPLTLGASTEIPVQAARNYELYLETDGMQGRLYRTLAAEDLPVHLDIDLAFGRLTFGTQAMLAEGGTLEYLTVRQDASGWTYSHGVLLNDAGQAETLLVPSGELHVTYKLEGPGEPQRIQVQVAAGEEANVELR